MVKVFVGPTQVFATGVITKVATTGLEVALIAIKLGCPSVPVASTPMLNSVFVHGYVVPATGEPLKTSAGAVALLQ